MNTHGEWRVENGKERKKRASQPARRWNVWMWVNFYYFQKSEKKQRVRVVCNVTKAVRLWIQIELYIISRAFKLRSGLAILRSRISIRKLLFGWKKIYKRRRLISGRFSTLFLFSYSIVVIMSIWGSLYKFYNCFKCFMHPSSKTFAFPLIWRHVSTKSLL